ALGVAAVCILILGDVAALGRAVVRCPGRRLGRRASRSCVTRGVFIAVATRGLVGRVTAGTCVLRAGSRAAAVRRVATTGDAGVVGAAVAALGGGIGLTRVTRGRLGVALVVGLRGLPVVLGAGLASRVCAGFACAAAASGARRIAAVGFLVLA